MKPALSELSLWIFTPIACIEMYRDYAKWVGRRFAVMQPFATIIVPACPIRIAFIKG